MDERADKLANECWAAVAHLIAQTTSEGEAALAKKKMREAIEAVLPVAKKLEK